MVADQRTEDDDAPFSPRRAVDDEGEENFEPEDDTDLGLDDEQEIGLDTDAGPEEAFEEPIDDDEGSSWLDDGRDVSGIAGEQDFDAYIDERDEDSARAELESDDQPDEWDDDFGFDERSDLEGDTGEEGLGEDGLLAGLELDRLPPLDDGGSTDDETAIDVDPLTADFVRELQARAGEEELEESLEAIAPGLRCARLPSEQVRVELLQKTGQPLALLLAAGDVGVAWDGKTVLVAEPAASAPDARFAPGGAALAMAAAAFGERTLVALATPRGIACSTDAGRSFGPWVALPDAGVVSALAFTRTQHGPRLFAAGASGPLYASDDAGVTFRCVRPEARVLRLAGDGRSALALLGRDRGAATALRSADAGEGFEPLELPVSEPERVQSLQAEDDFVLCCRRSPAPQLLLWSEREQSWSDIAGGQAPATLIGEPAGHQLYFTAGRRIVRTAADLEGRPVIIAELPEDAGLLLQLAAASHSGSTVLHVGTERAWYRITLPAQGGSR